MYNATVYHIYPSNIRSTATAKVKELNGRLQILRSNMVQCTGLEDKLTSNGDAAYHAYLERTHPGHKFEIELDNCQGYRQALGV